MWGVTGFCGLAKQSALQPQACPCSESNTVSPIRESPPAWEGAQLAELLAGPNETIHFGTAKELYERNQSN